MDVLDLTEAQQRRLFLQNLLNSFLSEIKFKTFNEFKSKGDIKKRKQQETLTRWTGLSLLEEIIKFNQEQEELEYLITDKEISVVAKQIHLDLKCDSYLIGEIFDFLSEIKTGSKWKFRYAQGGDFYWSNEETGDITKLFPDLKILKNHISGVKLLNDKIAPYVIFDDQSLL